jgi:hypothetical protein
VPCWIGPTKLSAAHGWLARVASNRPIPWLIFYILQEPLRWNLVAKPLCRGEFVNSPCHAEELATWQIPTCGIGDLVLRGVGEGGGAGDAGVRTALGTLLNDADKPQPAFEAIRARAVAAEPGL